MKLKDLTNKTFGRWTVLRRVQSHRSATIWRCRCECGMEKDVYSTHLIQGNSKGCTKCRGKSQRGKNHHQWTGYGDICGDYWDCIKRGADGSKGRREPVPFEISIEYAWNLFLEQNKKCALSGIEIFIDYKRYEHDHTASLDRIDSSLGYIKGNVQWVHKDINLMKRTYDQNYFIELCQKVANNYDKSISN